MPIFTDLFIGRCLLFLCGATAEQILRFRQQGLIFRFVQIGVVGQNGVCTVPAQAQGVHILHHICQSQLRQTVLPLAKEVAGAAQPQVLVGNLEAVTVFFSWSAAAGGPYRLWRR